MKIKFNLDKLILLLSVALLLMVYYNTNAVGVSYTDQSNVNRDYMIYALHSTGNVCPTGSTCPTSSLCASSCGCVTNCLCPTGSGCTTTYVCPTGGDCVTSSSCLSGADCVSGAICTTNWAKCPTIRSCLTKSCSSCFNGGFVDKDCPTSCSCVASVDD